MTEKYNEIDTKDYMVAITSTFISTPFHYRHRMAQASAGYLFGLVPGDTEVLSLNLNDPQRAPQHLYITHVPNIFASQHQRLDFTFIQVWEQGSSIILFSARLGVVHHYDFHGNFQHICQISYLALRPDEKLIDVAMVPGEPYAWMLMDSLCLLRANILTGEVHILHLAYCTDMDPASIRFSYRSLCPAPNHHLYLTDLHSHLIYSLEPDWATAEFPATDDSEQETSFDRVQLFHFRRSMLVPNLQQVLFSPRGTLLFLLSEGPQKLTVEEWTVSHRASPISEAILDHPLAILLTEPGQDGAFQPKAVDYLGKGWDDEYYKLCSLRLHDARTTDQS